MIRVIRVVSVISTRDPYDFLTRRRSLSKADGPHMGSMALVPLWTLDKGSG